MPSSSIHSAKPGLLHIPSPSCFQSYRSCTRNHHHQDQSLVAVCLSLTFGGFQSRYTQVIIQTIGDQWENAWDILGHLYPICWSSMTLQRTNNLEFETYVSRPSQAASSNVASWETPRTKWMFLYSWENHRTKWICLKMLGIFPMK